MFAPFVSKQDKYGGTHEIRTLLRCSRSCVRVCVVYDEDANGWANNSVRCHTFHGNSWVAQNWINFSVDKWIAKRLDDEALWHWLVDDRFSPYFLTGVPCALCEVFSTKLNSFWLEWLVEIANKRKEWYDCWNKRNRTSKKFAQIKKKMQSFVLTYVIEQWPRIVHDPAAYKWVHFLVKHETWWRFYLNIWFIVEWLPNSINGTSAALFRFFFFAVPFLGW